MASGEQPEADPTGKVVLLVCVECGWEYQYEEDEEDAPESLECEKCGNAVFRRFEDSETPDEALADFREATERDLGTDDAAGDVTRGDLYDLNNP